MRAVVTGSAGFIGSHLVDALIERGYRVSGIDRQSRFSRPGYEHHTLDLAESPGDTGLGEILARVDLVFHLAARPGVRGSGESIESMRWRDNVVATKNVCEVTPTTTPVVAVSSSSVYGGANVGRRGLIGSRETDRLRPRGGYARSKVAMELSCAERRAGGARVAVIRPFTVAGEGQRPDMAFAMWLDALRRGDPIRIFGSADRSRDITDVRDVVAGLVAAGEREVDGTINLGTGVSHRLIDMARALLAASGLDGAIVRQPVSTDEAEATLADTTRCHQLLGFVPEADLDSLLRRQVEASAPSPAMAVR